MMRLRLTSKIQSECAQSALRKVRLTSLGQVHVADLTSLSHAVNVPWACGWIFQNCTNRARVMMRVAMRAKYSRLLCTRWREGLPIRHRVKSHPLILAVRARISAMPRPTLVVRHALLQQRRLERSPLHRKNVRFWTARLTGTGRQTTGLPNRQQTGINRPCEYPACACVRAACSG